MMGNDPVNLLKSSIRLETITELLNTCKTNGLTKEECRVDKFISLTMYKLKRSQSNDSWKEQVKVCFEQVLSTTYISSSIKKYVKPLSHQEAYLASKLNKDKREEDMDKLRSLSIGPITIGDLMDVAANCNTEADFNKYCDMARI